MRELFDLYRRALTLCAACAAFYTPWSRAASPIWEGSCARPTLSLLLYAYTDQFKRTKLSKAWFQYKNRPASPSRTWSLDFTARPTLPVSLEPLPWLSLPSEISTYEQAVLQLRAGDTVNFGSESFRLGRFLGAGNASHVFQIVDAKGKPTGEVLKIPFLQYWRIAPNEKNGAQNVYQETLNAGLHQAKSLESKRHGASVHLRHDPQGKFTICREVQEVIRGDQWLQRLLRKNQFVDTQRERSLSHLAEPERSQVRDLLELMLQNEDASLKNNHWVLDIEQGRQYLFDGAEWHLVDAE